MIQYSVTELQFMDGTVEDIPENGVTVIVGPNNTGKSVLLSEINQFIGDGHTTQRKWLSGVKVRREEDVQVFDRWFASIARSFPLGQQYAGKVGLFQTNTTSLMLPFDEARQGWMDGSPLGMLASQVVAYLDAMTRASLLLASAPRDPTSPALTPIHRIWDDRRIEISISEMIERAFGFEVSINRYSLTPQLLMGRPGRPDEQLPGSRELHEEYASLPSLSTQGDGVKSFASILLSSMASGVAVTLIDEPEVYLHPPQARLLGRYLTEETPLNGQIIVATHSADVLQGMLNGHSDRPVKVIRLTVDGLTSARERHTLPSERLATLWRDPLLRYSRMLDGLFHKGVVVCESDGDCRFYEAVLDVYLAKRVEHDLLFTHIGGKARFSRSVKDLKAFKLRTAIIGDIDVLNNKNQMLELVRSAGGSWEVFESDFRLIEEQMSGRTSGPTVGSLRGTLSGVLSRGNQSRITDQESRDITESVKLKKGWVEAKRSGVAAFDGDAGRAIVRILDELMKIGVFIVPVGELERWFKDVNAGHGISFVTRALETNRHERLTPDLESFLKNLTEYFGISLR